MKRIFATFMVLAFGIILLGNQANAETDVLGSGFDDSRKAAAEKIAKEPIANCYQNLVSAYDLEQAEFFAFLETNFLNKSSASSLTNIAISRFSEFKLKLNELYGLLTPNVNLSTGTAASSDELASLSNCNSLIEEYSERAKETMIKHIKNNSAQKNSIIMVEKYKAVNIKLRDMNLQIAKMYGSLMAFNSKLPWFSKQCIQN